MTDNNTEKKGFYHLIRFVGGYDEADWRGVRYATTYEFHVRGAGGKWSIDFKSDSLFADEEDINYIGQDFDTDNDLWQRYFYDFYWNQTVTAEIVEEVKKILPEIQNHISIENFTSNSLGVSLLYFLT